MKHIAKITTVLLLSTFLFVGPAGAVTSVKTHTKLTPSKTKIHKGDLVRFKVVLSSPKKKCRSHMRIDLHKGKKVVAHKKTDRHGRVTFKQHPKKTAKWWAKFKGAKVGKHPKRFNCQPSQSKKKKVVVKK